MKKNYTTISFIIVFLFIVYPFMLWAQPSIAWQNNLGGTDSDINPYIIKTADNGFLISGTSNSNDIDVMGNHGSFDFWIIKTDSTGNISWQKCFGGSNDDNAKKSVQTTDGGYFIVGSTKSNNGDVSINQGLKDIWLIKLNAAGSLEWQKTFGGTGDDEAVDIILSSDSNYVIAANTTSNNGDVLLNKGLNDYWLLKINTDGNIIWQKTYGGSHNDFASSVIQINDSSYIIAGFTYSSDGDITNHYSSNSYADFFIVKTDSIGNKSWVKNYGGNSNDILTCALKTSDGGYIFGGFSSSDNGNITTSYGYNDGWLVKTNIYGGIQWQKNVGGNDNDMVFFINQLTDDDYIVCGNTSSDGGMVTGNHGNKDIWVLRLGNSGPVKWQRCLGGSQLDDAYSIALINDENSVIAGFSNSYDGNITENNGDFDYWLLKLENLSNIYDYNFSDENINIFPNPSNTGYIKIWSNINISEKSVISIIDLQGRIIKQKEITGILYETFNVNDIYKGVYIVTLTCDSYTFSRKFIIN